MKTRLIIMLTSSITAVCFLIGAFFYIDSQKDNLTVSMETLHGNPSAIYGADIDMQSFYSFNSRMTWDIRFQAGYEDKADIRFKKTERENFSDMPAPEATMSTEYTFFNQKADMAETEQKMLKDALKQADSKEIAAAEDIFTALKLSDYMSELPMQLGIYSCKYQVITADDSLYSPNHEFAAVEKGLRDYFRISVTDDMLFDVVLKKNEPDHAEEFSISADSQYSVPMLCTADESGVFLAFNRLHYSGPVSEYDDNPPRNDGTIPLPKGSAAAGIHYIPCLKEKDKNIDTRIPDTDKIRLLYPLSEDAVLLQFSENADGKSLLLLTAEDKKLCLSVIDKTEGKLLQKILLKHIGKETFHPDAANSYISDRDSHILITENDSVYLLRKSGRKYSLLLSGSYREKLNYTKRDIPYFPYFDFDGEKLALIMASSADGFGGGCSASDVMVFTEKGLAFSGTVRINIEESYPCAIDSDYPAKIALPGSVVKDENYERS